VIKSECPTFGSERHAHSTRYDRSWRGDEVPSVYYRVYDVLRPAESYWVCPDVGLVDGLGGEGRPGRCQRRRKTARV